MSTPDRYGQGKATLITQHETEQERPVTHYVYEYSDDDERAAASARACGCGNIEAHRGCP